jgi:hypothetical protein
MEFENYVKWLFPESIGNGCDMSFVELCEYPKGKGQVMKWLGKSGDFIGDFQCFPSKIKNLKEIQLRLGKDDTAWKGKLFHFVPTEDKKNFVISLL